jgi:hypothetical protein
LAQYQQRMRMETPRAKRVSLPVPITYRSAGDDTWVQGRILNLSESGVMFAPAALEVGQSIEVIFSTPASVASFASGKILCVGKVVRTTPAGDAAAQFEECRFLLDS